MMPDRVSNPGPLTYESGALPIALRQRRNDRARWTTKKKNGLVAVGVAGGLSALLLSSR